MATSFLSSLLSFPFAFAAGLPVFLAFRLETLSRFALLPSHSGLLHGLLSAFHARSLLRELLATTLFELGWLVLLRLVVLAALEALLLVVLLPALEALGRRLLSLSALVTLLVGLLLTLLVRWLLLLPSLLVPLTSHLLGLLGARLLVLAGLALLTPLESLLLGLTTLGLVVALLLG